MTSLERGCFATKKLKITIDIWSAKLKDENPEIVNEKSAMFT